MTKILGHDIDGRPLRAGDRCVILDTSEENKKHRGAYCSILGESPIGREWVEIDINHDNSSVWEYFDIPPEALRKLPNHKPAEDDFKTMMSKLKTGRPVAC